MQRMIGTNVVYDQNTQQPMVQQDGSLDKLQDYVMDTPPSEMTDSDRKNKQRLNRHQDQIQKELRQLLAQSPTNQMIMLGDEGQNSQITSSEERELRKKWLHDNGLFSQENSQPITPAEEKPEELEDSADKDEAFYPKADKSIELVGEQPLDVSNKDLLNEDFELDGGPESAEKEEMHSDSPRRVPVKDLSLVASKPPPIPKPQNFKGSPKNFSQNQDLTMMVQKDEKALLSRAQDAKRLPSPKDGKAPKAKDIEKAIDQSNAEGDENDSFHRLYNKEIKVNQDEIPLLLLELTDIAYKFIKKD